MDNQLEGWATLTEQQDSSSVAKKFLPILATSLSCIVSYPLSTVFDDGQD